MEAGDWIALYAAIIGTVAFGWQGAAYLIEHRPKLRVELMLVHSLETEEARRVAAGKPETISNPWRLQVEVHNLRGAAVRVSEVQIETNRGSGGYDVWRSSDWGLPWVLEPFEERTVFITDDDVGTLTRGQDLTAEVQVTPKRVFRTETLRVGEPGPVSELVELPEEHFRELVRISGSQQRFFTMRVQELGGTPGRDSEEDEGTA